MQAPRPCGRALRENIQDQLGAVKDLALGDAGQSIELRGRELAVKDNHPRVFSQGEDFKIRRLAASEEEFKINLSHPLNQGAGHMQLGGACELGELGEAAFLREARRGGDADQNGALPAFLGGGQVLPQGEFVFKPGGQGREIQLHLVPVEGADDPIVLAAGAGRREMSEDEGNRKAKLVDLQNAQTVQAQKQKVHEVFLGERLPGEVGVQKTQAAQTGAARPPVQFGDVYAPGVTDEDKVHSALTVEKNRYLAGKAARQGGQFPSLIKAVAPRRRVAAGIQPLQGFYLAGLKPLQVSINFSGYDFFLLSRL